MVDFGQAIKRPFSDFKILSIGAAIMLGITLIALIPWIGQIAYFLLYMFIVGYGFVCAKTAMQNKFKLPAWKDWGYRWLFGLRGTIVSFIYNLPWMIVGVVFGGLALFNLIIAGSFGLQRELTAAEVMGIFGALGSALIIIGIVAIFIFYVVPAGLMAFVKADSFKEAFKLGTIFKKAFTANYFVAWIVAIAYSIGVSIVMGLVAVLLALTIVLPFVVIAYGGMVIAITTMTIFGQVWSEIK